MSGMSDPSQLEWWRDAALLDTYRSVSASQGLTGPQAQQRLAELGPNRFGQTTALPGWRQYLRHFRNPLVLPFLPMLPTQILLNNILYDLSELPIPFDAVDAEDTAHPRAMDMDQIRRFMFTIGPVSSLFDFITFAVLLKVFDATEALFQTGWFVESLCTQVLVIFVIRTRGNPLRSRPHPMLTATSLAIVALAMLLPFTPLGAAFGFTPLPAGFYAALVVMVLSYLAVVMAVRRWVERRAV